MEGLAHFLTNLVIHDRSNDGVPAAQAAKFDKHSDKQFTKKLIAELTAANAVSLSRIPLVLASLALARKKPPLLSALLAGVHALDAVDGYVARKWGLGNSPYGADIDILSDHFVELIIVFDFAYKMKAIPKAVPWILATRDVATDFLRFYNEAFYSAGRGETHPHKAFGTFDKKGRATYAVVKIIESVAVPLIPSLGLWLSIAHVLTSFYRGWPVLTSKTSQQIYRQIFENITKQKPSSEQ